MNDNFSRSNTNAFWQIFLFEIKYRIKRPDIYIYFFGFFAFSFLSFAMGEVPAPDHVHINTAVVITKFFVITSIFMMIVTAAVMGIPLYRDLEYNTHEYYLSYPITKNEYFWGRFFGSFLFVIIIASSLVWGSILGTYLGPRFGWVDQSKIGAFRASNYIHPFFVFLLPNIFLTGSIFFGLVAHARNIKVVYSAGLILYTGYMIALFTFQNSQSTKACFFLDPFGFAPLNVIQRYLSVDDQNNSLIHVNGLMLWNRLIWSVIGLAILAVTYYRFSFIRFFAGRSDKNAARLKIEKQPGLLKIPLVFTSFKKGYNRNIITNLSKIEFLSIVRDPFFRLIFGIGIFFLGFIFWIGLRTYNVHDLPRTAMILRLYYFNFTFFTFVILLFYTGEAVHREKTTRFAIINDSLPPADRIFYGSKLIALLALSFIMASIPMIIGIVVQIAKGYFEFNLPIYLVSSYAIFFPLFVLMMVFSFAVHVLVNNKFAGHAVGLTLWSAISFFESTHRFDYKLLLYGRVPDFTFSDMDGIGPSFTSINWFNLYWFFAGGLLVILASVFYYRGTIVSFMERCRLAMHRVDRNTKIITAILIGGFFATGAYNYYNVSYLNTWLTRKEHTLRTVAFERNLKQYEHDPLPTIVGLKYFTDIFPDKRKVQSTSLVTIVNETDRAITRLLLDGDNLSSFEIKYNGENVPFTCPLIYPRAKFSFFKNANDTSMYRLYSFSHALRVGDTAVIEVQTVQQPRGFTNGYSFVGVIHNGVATIPLPGMGYDDDEELDNNDERKKYGLPIKNLDDSKQDPELSNRLLVSDAPAGLINFEATISTSGDQIALSPGKMDRQWKENGRNYFHYTTANRIYPEFPILSAKYSLLRDSVRLVSGKNIGIELYYHQPQNANINRMIAGLKNGLSYCSKNFGKYQSDKLVLAESSVYTSNASVFENLVSISERFAWNASFTDTSQFDYCYFYASYYAAQQWWIYQAAPSHLRSSNTISAGLPKYSALQVYENKVGRERMRNYWNGEIDWYLFWHQYHYEKENNLLNANRDWLWDTKASIAFNGIRDFIGEDSLNAALKEFHDEYAFRNKPPYAGVNDLYRIIKKHVPDSLQYFLTDSWERITVYNNKFIDAKLIQLENNGGYKVRVKLHGAKTYTDSLGNDIAAPTMNDLIDIGIYGSEKPGEHSNILYLKKHRIKAGDQEIEIVVREKPVSVFIDPYHFLIDDNKFNNEFNF